MSKIGINGFSRLGRIFLRRCLRKKASVVAINDAALKPDYVAYLLKHDSTYGRLKVEICGDKEALQIGGKKIIIFSEKDPAKIRWKDASVDFVVDCSGQFKTQEKASKHLEGGAKKVIIVGTSPDAPMFVCGVNLEHYKSDMTVISAATCTLNALCPLAKVLHENFCIEEGIVTDIHALNSSQKVLDGIGEDWRNSRSCLQNIIPSTLDLTRTMSKIMPELSGKLTGMAFTVPVPNVSVVDLTVRLQKQANIDYLSEKVKEASNGCLQDILGFTDDGAVSSDFNGYSVSSVYDAKANVSLNDKFHKLIIWYDNEYSFCCRILDLVKHVHKVDVEDAKQSKDKDKEKEKDKCEQKETDKSEQKETAKVSESKEKDDGKKDDEKDKTC